MADHPGLAPHFQIRAEAKLDPVGSERVLSRIVPTPPLADSP